MSDTGAGLRRRSSKVMGPRRKAPAIVGLALIGCSPMIRPSWMAREQPMNASLQAFDYVQSPNGGPRWAVRAQLQFLFPR